MVTNLTSANIQASICGSLQNFIGADGSNPQFNEINQAVYDHQFSKNINEYRASKEVCGLFMSSDGLDPEAETFGTLALTTLAAPLQELRSSQENPISYRTAWANLSWGDSLLDFWDDFSLDGRLENRDSSDIGGPTGSLSVGFNLAPYSTYAVTFLLTWHFPNRQTWTPAPHRTVPEPDQETAESDKKGCACGNQKCNEQKNTIGNYYTCQYQDAWDVARRIAPLLEDLEARTVEFVDTFIQSDLPEVVKEAALFNLSTLRSQTCFRTPDGNFFGFEGCDNHGGCCPGSCTHVWNYEQATAFLFGSLSRSMRDVEFTYSTNNHGQISFRTNLPLKYATEWGKAAADGQLGCLMKLYRDWQLSGDQQMLRKLWPKAKKSVGILLDPKGMGC